jgi:hypothetical protein
MDVSSITVGPVRLPCRLVVVFVFPAGLQADRATLLSGLKYRRIGKAAMPFAILSPL